MKRRSPFSPEELAEMAAADAEIEVEFRLTQDDLDFSKQMDRLAKFESLPLEKQKVAAQQKAYREANRDKVAAQQKAYYEANRDKVAARRKAYYEANRDKVAAQKKAYREANREKYNAYMREYMRRRKSLSANRQNSGPACRRLGGGEGPAAFEQ